jgi:LPS-assembly lipoprotein
MSWFKAVAVSLCLFVAACGFQPLYGENSAAHAVLSNETPGIEIGQIPDRDGQYLRNQLIDRLYTNGRPASAKYDLKFTPLVKNIFNMGIERSASATRAQIAIATHMQLIDRTNGEILLERDLHNSGAYNLLDNQLATLSSQQSTMERILQEIADSAVLEVSLYLKRQQEGVK